MTVQHSTEQVSPHLIKQTPFDRHLDYFKIFYYNKQCTHEGLSIEKKRVVRSNDMTACNFDSIGPLSSTDI